MRSTSSPRHAILSQMSSKESPVLKAPSKKTPAGISPIDNHFTTHSKKPLPSHALIPRQGKTSCHLTCAEIGGNYI